MTQTAGATTTRIAPGAQINTKHPLHFFSVRSACIAHLIL